MRDIRVMPMAEMPTPSDLSEVAFDEACKTLGIDHASATILAGAADTEMALAIARQFGAWVGVVPDGIFQSDAWLVLSDIGAIGSEGS